MRIYLNQNVFEKAIERISWLFDEFETVAVTYSGGKDSTVTLNLALIVAEQKGRLPVPVMFLDQEAEWGSTIEMVRDVMNDPRVKPYWMQIPFKLNNSTSTSEKSEDLDCWKEDEEDKWMRPKEEISYKENIYGQTYFNDLIIAIMEKEFGTSTACLAGVRAEESPARMMGLTQGHTYGGETWGKIINAKKKIFTFYPIYDWSYTDVWKSIHDNKWQYAKLYDYQYRHGVSLNDMRLSSLIHETALKALSYMQEIEPDTWAKLSQRIDGINSEGILSNETPVPKKLPYMFKSWLEYRDYLIDKLIPEEDLRNTYKNHFKLSDGMHYNPFFYIVGKDFEQSLINYFRVCVKTLIRNDHFFTQMGNYDTANRIGGFSSKKTDEENEANWLKKWDKHGRAKGITISKKEEKYKVLEKLNISRSDINE